VAESVNPAFPLPGWFSNLAKAVGRKRSDAASVQEELPLMVDPAVSVADPVVGDAFKIVGAQQMCRGKDECQDAFGSAQGDGWFVACVADGAGSSPCGRQGAQQAVASVLESLTASMEGDPVTRITEAFRAAHQALLALAESEHRETKDFRTTLAVAIGDRVKVVAGHVGDSLIVVADSHGIRPILRPKNGEFGNTTFFVTAADYETHLQFAETEGRWFGLSMQTDGLEAVTYWKQRDDLEAATYKALFSILDRLDTDAAYKELSLFVSEDAIMDKCNDDLTLLCVVPVSTHADARTPDRPESA